MALRGHKHFTRYVLALQYHGGNFLGIVRQKDEGTTLPLSVESRLHNALTSLVGEGNHEHFQISSRTDRGVHALCNTCHIDIRPRRKRGAFPSCGTWDLVKLQRGLNHFLNSPTTAQQHGDGFVSHPKDSLRVINSAFAPTKPYPNPYHVIDDRQPSSIDWHARFTTLSRTYCYHILVTPSMDDGVPFLRDRVWRIFSRDPRFLNVENMNKASQFLMGEHDFSSFRGKHCQRSDPVVSLEQIHVTERQGDTCLFTNMSQRTNSQMLTLTVTGNSFVYRQVRNIVGCLVSVGQGKLSPEDVRDILRKRDRRVAPDMAPAHGLFLVDVQHDCFEFD